MILAMMIAYLVVLHLGRPEQISIGQQIGCVGGPVLAYPFVDHPSVHVEEHTVG